jgi:hypothetical protein
MNRDTGDTTAPRHRAGDAKGGRFQLPATSLPWLAGLVLLVGVAWCSGTGRWTAAAWDTPTQYLDGFYADVVSTFAWMKAAGDGHVIPLAWKTVPELGAPFDANWSDWPSVEELPVICFGLLGRAFGLFAGLNISLLAGHLLAAVTMFLVARELGCSAVWSFVAGLAYGLAPFIFAQSPHHITVAYAWHVPLFLLVWRWAAAEPGLRFGSREFRWAVAIAVVTGLQNVYWTNIFCQLTLLGAGALAVRTNSRAVMKPALAVIGVAALAFALMNVDTWTFRAVNGPNSGGVVREYKWLEIYGLKLVDLVVPPATHHSGAFAAFGAAHHVGDPARGVPPDSPLQDEGSYLGLVGLAALGLLVVVSAAAVLRRRADSIPMEAWWVLWIVLCFTTGGFNAILGAAGFTLFRTGCRYSVVILAVVLGFAARWLTARDRESAASGPASTPAGSLAAAAAVCLLVLWDQVPRAPAAGDTATNARQVAADRDFVQRMEAALPPGAAVFQLPIMRFPEEPAPGVPPYDHFRPYLYSQRLRFSYGSMKGREREQWQQELGQGPLDKAVDVLKQRGFSAIYINRNGFPDKGQKIVDQLRGLGHAKPLIESESGDLVCVPID